MRRLSSPPLPLALCTSDAQRDRTLSQMHACAFCGETRGHAGHGFADCIGTDRSGRVLQLVVSPFAYEAFLLADGYAWTSTGAALEEHYWLRANLIQEHINYATGVH